MSKSRRTRSGLPAAPALREDANGIVEAIQATQESMRRRIEADPVLRQQLYEDHDASLDGLKREIVKELRQFLNIPKPGRTRAKQPRKGRKK